MTAAKSCSECAFWSDAGPNEGSCRRSAPRPTERADQIAHWPATLFRERCGEGVLAGPDTPPLVSCGQCRFWSTHATGGLDPQDRRDARRDWWDSAGHCVRYAPGPSSDPGARGYWRATHITDSCADGEAPPA